MPAKQLLVFLVLVVSFTKKVLIELKHLNYTKGIFYSTKKILSLIKNYKKKKLGKPNMDSNVFNAIEGLAMFFTS